MLGTVQFKASLTFISQSRISQELLEFLRTLGVASSIGADRYLLKELELGGVPIKNLEVTANSLLVRLQLDGILGLDFLQQFRVVRFEPESLQLSFEDP